VNSEIYSAESNQRSKNNYGYDNEDVTADNCHCHNRERRCRMTRREGVVFRPFDNLIVIGGLFAGTHSADKTFGCNFTCPPGYKASGRDVYCGINVSFKEKERNAHNKPDKSACAQSGYNCHYSVVGAIMELFDFSYNHSIHISQVFKHTKTS